MLCSFPLAVGESSQQLGGALQDTQQQQLGNPQGLTKKQLQLEKLRAKNRRSQARYREKCKVGGSTSQCDVLLLPRPSSSGPSSSGLKRSVTGSTVLSCLYVTQFCAYVSC